MNKNKNNRKDRDNENDKKFEFIRNVLIVPFI